MRIRYYRTIRGDEPVRDYLATLPARERDDWDETLVLIGELGLEAPVSFRQLEGKLWEIRWESIASRTSSSGDPR